MKYIHVEKNWRSFIGLKRCQKEFAILMLARFWSKQNNGQTCGYNPFHAAYQKPAFPHLSVLCGRELLCWKQFCHRCWHHLIIWMREAVSNGCSPSQCVKCVCVCVWKARADTPGRKKSSLECHVLFVLWKQQRQTISEVFPPLIVLIGLSKCAIKNASTIC